MMKQSGIVAILILACFSFSRCSKDLDNIDKYARPSWLSGKLYTQVKAEATLSLFAQALKLTGYDTVINTSGSFTVFAPSDSAFNVYFQSHPGINSLTDIPADELLRLVKYHLVQNPWSIDQLRSLDVYGWIDSNDINNDEPRGFKRETLLREKNPKFGVKLNENRRLVITDTLSTSRYRRQYTDSRKFVPLFYRQLMDIYKLKSSDFEFYFGRGFESSSMYFAGAKIIKSDIFAENGFIQIIDRVVEPLSNASQILARKGGTFSYSKFLDLVNVFPEFSYDEERTEDQPGFEEGLQVDSLFNIAYPQLAFSITNERTRAPSGALGLPANVTIRYHHGMAAPTNEAFDQLVNTYIAVAGGWGSIAETPLHIKRIIANSHLSAVSLYPSDFSEGFFNGEKDVVPLDAGTIVQKEFGSNCTFIGLNKAIVPRAFTSITGPIYLQANYSTAMYMIENSGLLPALKKKSNSYSLYIESDISLRDDSSLLYDQTKKTFTAWQIIMGVGKPTSVSTSNLRTLLLNHIGTEEPLGTARKEFIRNLAGNFIIVNNTTGEVSGTAPTTAGYLATQTTKNFPVQVSQNADNGATYEIKNWFNFGVSNMFQKLSASYPKFHQLIQKAGLMKDQFTYSFLSANEFYTVLAPSDSALNAYNADTISIANLKKFVLLHFIQGKMIFTDGRAPSGYYETLRVDERSTPYITYFTRIYIAPGIDQIRVIASGGSDYLLIPESARTNVITGLSLVQGQTVYPEILSTGVVHEAKRVLLANQLDRQ